MGVVGGLSDMSENIAVSKGLKAKKSGPNEGGIGKGIVMAINAVGRFFNPKQFRDIE